LKKRTGRGNILKFWHYLSISTQMLIVFSTVLLISIISLSLINYSRVNEILKKKELENTQSVLNQVRSVVDTNLELIDRLSYVIFSNDRVIEILKYNPITFDNLSLKEYSDIENLLYDVLFTRDDLSGVSLYNNIGEVISTEPYNPAIDFDYLSELADIADGSLVWLNYNQESNTLSAVRKVYDFRMRPIGYLQLDIRKNSLLDMLSPSFTEKNGSILIFNRGKIILKGNPNYPVTESVQSAALSGKILEQDSNIIVSVDSLVNEWQYAGIIPLAEVYRDTITIRTYILFSTLLAVAIFSIVSMFITRKLTSSLHELAENMKTIYLKDWKPQIQYTGHNEIAYLIDQFNDMGLRLNSMAEELVEKESLQIKQQFETLQAQINPHFLYNTLDIVSWMAIRHKLPEISKIVLSMSDIMRYSITSSSTATLNDEISHIKNYLAIQEIRFPDKFKYRLSIDKSLNEIPVPKLILQPLVENSILHGFKGNKNNAVLSITAIKDGKGMIISIVDNGVGMPEHKATTLLDSLDVERSTGIGVYNVHRRLILTYGKTSGLEINSQLDVGTSIVIRIPFVESNSG
jgi:two-component system, sensor histidine kinase YesM